MDQKMNIIMNNFEIKKFNRICNFKGCKKTPTKEALLFEFDTRTQSRRAIVSLYLCEDHYNVSMRFLLEELNKICESGKTVRVEVFDTGCITY